MATVGFIGLGNMGAPMAANLLKAGHQVIGYDVVASAGADLAQKGGPAVSSAPEAAAAGEIVITMLPAGPQVRQVYLGPDGVIARARPGALLIDCSMIAVCEGFALGEKLGLPAQTLFDICSKSTSQCWAMTGYCPVPGPVPAAPSNRGYAPGFTAANMLKDLRLAQQAAGATAAATPLGAAAANLYQMFVDDGGGALDFSGIMRFLSRQSHA